MIILVSLIIIIYGLVCVISPETVFRINHLWGYKNAEPSDAWLIWTRIAGVIFIIIGIWLLFSPSSFYAVYV